MDSAADNGKFEVPLSRCFGVNERLEDLSTMIDISTVISKWLVIDDHLPVSLRDINLSLAAFPLTIAEVSIRHFGVGLLHLVQRILGLLKREKLEFHLRADGSISDVVLVHSLSVLVEDAEVIEICVSVEIHGHFVERKFHG